mgnify:CR=1 FL=1
MEIKFIKMKIILQKKNEEVINLFINSLGGNFEEGWDFLLNDIHIYIILRSIRKEIQKWK